MFFKSDKFLFTILIFLFFTVSAEGEEFKLRIGTEGKSTQNLIIKTDNSFKKRYGDREWLKIKFPESKLSSDENIDEIVIDDEEGKTPTYSSLFNIEHIQKNPSSFQEKQKNNRSNNKTLSLNKILENKKKIISDKINKKDEPKEEIRDDFWNTSSEGRKLNSIYRKVLNRDVDRVGFKTFITEWRRGKSWEAIEESIKGSVEYIRWQERNSGK